MDIFDKYKVDRAPRELLYVLGRVGLFIVVNVFAIFAGIFSCAGVSTVIAVIFDNKNKFVSLELIPFLGSSTTTSMVGFIILTGIMLRLFWDDGKRHTAYGRFSIPVVLIAVFFMAAVYSVPLLFFDNTKDSLSAAIRSFYTPSLWLREVFKGNMEIPVVISAGIIAILCMVFYKLSGDRYIKKHPDLLENF
ncbi:MAG: hypothetical protein E7509_02310 [Ruminococcus sp.]|nr:hypothetical protein [Ruminococcus sp.]